MSIDVNKLYFDENEKPLDKLITDGGFCGIFRTIGCVGDSLSSGEMESLNEAGETGYHDYYEYSWGQFIARNIGAKVYNFSRGGMTAEEYCKSFADANNFWSPTKECQAYIIALGVNEFHQKKVMGDISDIDVNDWHNNADTFVGYYAQIISRYKQIQPKAKFFLMTMPNGDGFDSQHVSTHRELLYKLAEVFDNTYVLDLYKYGPSYNDAFKEKFYLGGHLNAMGYVFTARLVESYIDYIIRHNMEDFKQTAFVGTAFHNVNAKW